MTLIQETVEKFRASQVGFTPEWAVDQARKCNTGEHLIVRPTLRVDGLKTDFEYFWYNPKTGKVSFGYITGCYEGHMSGDFIEVYSTFKSRESVVRGKWQACWRIAKKNKTAYSTLFPIVQQVFDNDGRD